MLLEEPNPAAIASRIRSVCAGDDYTAYHAPRYASILGLLRDLVTQSSRVCDVDRSKLTDMIAAPAFDASRLPTANARLTRQCLMLVIFTPGSLEAVENGPAPERIRIARFFPVLTLTRTVSAEQTQFVQHGLLVEDGLAVTNLEKT